jgi:hypothetical protein
VECSKSEKSVTVDVQFHCDGGYAHVYDPFFILGDPKRAQLRVFDTQGKYVGNALRAAECDDLGRGRWVYIQVQHVTGRRLTIEAGERTFLTPSSPPAKPEDARIDQLGVGKYLLQFVMKGRYIDFREETDDEPRPRRGVDPDAEICYSNVLEVEVLPRTRRQFEGAIARSGPPGEGLPDNSPHKAPFSAALAVENEAIKSGQDIEYSITLVNETDRSAPIMDLRRSFPMWAETTRLLALDSEGKALGDLLANRKMMGNGSFIARTNWITIPPGGIYGVKDRVHARISPLASDLPPATYGMQMAFLDRFASEHPYAKLPPPESLPDGERDQRYVERLRRWRADYPGKVLFRSNRVELEILPRTGD